MSNESSTSIKHDALFYVLDKELASYVKRDVEYCEYKRSLHFARPCLRKHEQALPEELNEWSYLILEVDLPMLKRGHLSDITIADVGTDYLTDVSKGFPIPVVSEKAKKIIEGFDPDYSKFVPMKLTGRPSGMPHGGPWYHWFVQRRLMFKPNEIVPASRKMSTDNYISPAIQWELVHNNSLREMVSGFPFWCRGSNSNTVMMRRDVFLVLKQAKVTGLNEDVGRFWEPEETIGHLI